MKKIKKILLITTIAIVALVIVAALVVGFCLDGIVKKGIQNVAPGITQTPVTLDSVNILIFSGAAGINGLTIGNPEGFHSTNAIYVGKAHVAMVPGSILGDKVIVHSVEVRDAEITFEGNPFGANNLKKLMDNVDSSAGASKQEAATTPKPKGAARKLEVDDFLITGAKVHVELNTGIVNKEMTLPIPEIHLTGLGTGPDGITAAELTQQILKQVTTETFKAVAAQAGNLGKDVLNGAGGGAGKIGKSLGGLFGK